jgi:hypothetical protein
VAPLPREVSELLFGLDNLANIFLRPARVLCRSPQQGTSRSQALNVVAGAIRSAAKTPSLNEPQLNKVRHAQMKRSARRRPMKGKTTVMTTLLFTLSLSPVWVMAEDEINTLPLPQKQACADSETAVWCADASDDSGMVEVRHPLAQVKDRDGGRDYFYNIESGECELCFDN